jgi:outer membrane receptor for ferrienterochelin and colicins
VVNKEGKHLPFAHISVKGTTIGTTTDETGHYQLINLPEGEWVLRANFLGYKPQEKKVSTHKGETKEVYFELQEDMLGIEQITVTADRQETKRTETPVIVNTITPELFTNTQSVSLSEGLKFMPGLRMENNCQNCGFSQVRMNGLEGPYSQILINSRPIFSGLAGVYGLELIPSNMIERVEVIRGGGSALYGSNAIAGTINLILKEPDGNAYEAGMNTRLTGVGLEGSGGAAEDYNAHFNTSMVSSDNKTGMSLYGFYRDKGHFDANDDSFSELPSLKNTTFGTRVFHRFGSRSKLTADFFHIYEDRRGGNKFGTVVHEADIAEAVDHNITTGALTFDQYLNDKNKLSVYASGQRVNRDSYYGAEQSLSDYGRTKDFSYVFGGQYNMNFGISSLTIGVENQGAWLKDEKLGYPDVENANINFSDSTISIPHTDELTVADQNTNTLGTFAQYEREFGKLKVSAGLRYDRYQIKDDKHAGSDKTGNVLSPRLTLKYDVKEYLQARLSYSKGYRAPQIFDEDLHIETSGARQVVHRNDPDLEQETSNSYMASLDFNRQVGNAFLGLLVEGFYTALDDRFTNEFGAPDESGRVVYTRINADGVAKVKGINIELKYVPSKTVDFQGGFTMQQSTYEESQEFGEKNFFRSPDDYGYFTLNWNLTDEWGISSTGNYTGKMLVPYFGTQLENPDEGELRQSDRFFNFGMKLKYTTRLNGAKLQLFGGAKNLFNAYQNDFDTGINRDPGYIYGPMHPRSVYFGIKIGNKL